MDAENIVQMPTLLERLASKLLTCLKQEAHNRQEWIAIQEAKCATLVEIRDQFAADIEFGAWCNDNGFSREILNPETRAAAIAMGRQPEALHRCLEATRRRSLDTIHRLEFGRFCNITKPSRRKQPTAPKLNLAIETLNDLQADGISVTRKSLSKAAGVGQNTALRAILLKQAEETPPPVVPLEPADMPKTMRARYEAALRKARRELREEITAEVCAVYQDMVTWNRERVARADRIIASHTGVMSRDLFRRIKACLHPDHNTFAFAAEALQAFSELEKVLVKADDTAPVAHGLPKTAAEMMARRRTGRVN